MPFVFPQEAIDILSACQNDPEAKPGYEMISGSLIWTDENYIEFLSLCRSKGCNAYGALFAFRTSLIEGKPREELRFAWTEIRERCPEWIGFRPERMAPDADLQEFIRQEAENF